jgi:hypothetical protein
MDRTNYLYNLEYRAQVRGRMRALARGLISGELGTIAVARELNSFGDGVEPEIGELLNVFVAIHSETDALPIGKERSLWAKQALERFDLEIKAAEQRWRDKAFAASKELIRLLEED